MSIKEQTEPYQKEVKKKHKKMKIRLIGKGKNKKKEKGFKNPSYERSKSAPPIGENAEVEELVNEMRYVSMKDMMTKETLNKKFWNDDMSIREEVRERLIEIAEDFFERFEFENLDILNITLTGSLANYNWTEQSDLDLHIIVDYKQADENASLVKDFFDSQRILWNLKHEIIIRGHEVEIYVQDLAEPHSSTGVYSLTDNRWMTKPTKKIVKFDEKGVNRKAQSIMNLIHKLEDLFYQRKYEFVYHFAERLKQKISKFRKSGLEKGGEYSNENLSFKILRKTGYLKKLSVLHIESYDKLMSIENGGQKFSEEEPEEPANLSAYQPVF